MADTDISIDSLRDRLTDSLAEWGAQFSLVLAELEQMRALVEELRNKQGQDDDRVADLQRQLRVQSELMADLHNDVEEGAALRNKLHEKDVEIERLSSELASKQELIRVLRRDAEQSDQLKGELQLRDQRIQALKSENQAAKDSAERLAQDLEQLTESAREANTSAAERQALHVELDARKSLIQSLRSDLDRTSDLEEKLAESSALSASWKIRWIATPRPSRTCTAPLSGSRLKPGAAETKKPARRLIAPCRRCLALTCSGPWKPPTWNRPSPLT